MNYDLSSGIQSPRPETPEPESRQGRRNAQPGVQLLDDDGGISEKVRCKGMSAHSLNIVPNNLLVVDFNYSSSLASSIYFQNTARHLHQHCPQPKAKLTRI